MPRYLVESRTRFLVDGAGSPERVRCWFNDGSDIDLDVHTLSYDRLEVVGTVGDDVSPGQLEPGAYETWRDQHVAPLKPRRNCMPNTDTDYDDSLASAIDRIIQAAIDQHADKHHRDLRDHMSGEALTQVLAGLVEEHERRHHGKPRAA